MARWFRHWKPTWVLYGDSFRKAYMEEWEQEAHASEHSGQESKYRWKDTSSWSWGTQDLFDKETFARETHEASDEKWKHMRTVLGSEAIEFRQYPL